MGHLWCARAFFLLQPFFFFSFLRATRSIWLRRKEMHLMRHSLNMSGVNEYIYYHISYDEKKKKRCDKIKIRSKRKKKNCGKDLHCTQLYIYKWVSIWKMLRIILLSSVFLSVVHILFRVTNGNYNYCGKKKKYISKV